MNLKFRYASFLLLILLLLVLVGVLSIYLLYQQLYYVILLVLILLYAATFQLGRNFSTIFFVLSTLRHIRKNHGVLPITEYNSYIDRLLGSRRSPANKDQLKRDVLLTLEKENEIAIQDDTIILLLRTK